MTNNLRNFRAVGLFFAAAASVISGTVFAAEFHNETLDDGSEAIIITGDIVAGDEQRF